MGSRGRYGKYGEIKRLDRLRKVKTAPLQSDRQDLKPSVPFLRRTGYAGGRGIRIIPARPGDADYIRRLSKRVFNSYGPYEETLTGWFISGMAFTLLALEGKRPVGFAMLGRSGGVDFRVRIYELLAIAVEPGMQKLGIGTRLLNGIERRARDLHAETLILHTATDNLAGQRLFRKFGFVSSETKSGFYPAGQDAMMMYKGEL